MPPLTPGPGKVFVRPDERHKIRSSGLVVPTVAQDDAFHGEVLAVGAGAWFGRARGEAALRPEPADPPRGWERVKRVMPFSAGQTVFYEPEYVRTFARGFSADSEVVYVLEVRDIYGWIEHDNQVIADRECQQASLGA